MEEDNYKSSERMIDLDNKLLLSNKNWKFSEIGINYHWTLTQIQLLMESIIIIWMQVEVNQNLSIMIVIHLSGQRSLRKGRIMVTMVLLVIWYHNKVKNTPPKGTSSRSVI